MQQPTVKSNKRKSIISENLQNKKIQNKTTVMVVQKPKKILENISNVAKLSKINIEDNQNSEDDPLLNIDKCEGRSQSPGLEKVCNSSDYKNPVFTYRPDLD